MYNALVAADKAAPELGLSESVKFIEANYAEQLTYNNSYLQIQESNTVERRQLEAWKTVPSVSLFDYLNNTFRFIFVKSKNTPQ